MCPAALTPEQKRAKVEEKQIRNSTERPTRKKRSSFNGTEGKLRVNNQIEGYHLHIFNDTPGRIEQALDVGYEFVSPEEVGGVGINTVSRNTDLGDKVRFLVGKTENGEAMYAYLMKLRSEFYEEDQAALQSRIDKVDGAIRRGEITADGHSSDGRYIPREGISMKIK
jgi:hypothetical protein